MADTVRSTAEALGLLDPVNPVDPVNRIDFARQPLHDRPLFRERERQFLRDLLVSYESIRGVFVNVKDAPFYAMGNGIDDDTASIQAAIAFAGSTKKLLFPAGDYLISGAGTECLLVNGTAAGWVGEGLDRTRIVVKATVGAGTDGIRVLGAGGNGLRMEGMSIVPQAGTPGRYGLNIDVSVNTFAYALFEMVKIGRFGSYALKTTNSVAGVGTVSSAAGAAIFSNAQALPAGSTIVIGATTYVITAVADPTHATLAGAPTFGATAFSYPNVDGVFTSTLRNSYIDGGIWFDKAGDSLHLENTTVTGPRDVLIDLIYSGGDGAHGFTLSGGNVTPDGGIVVLSGNTTTIIDPNQEQPNNSTGTNSALIDLRGRQGAPLENVSIIRGFLGGTTGRANFTVRVDWCKSARIIRPTLISPGAQPGAQAVSITANAIATEIINPYVAPYGVLLESVVDDQGVGTQIDWVTPSGTNYRYIGHKASKTVGILTQAGNAQAAGSLIWGIIAAATVIGNILALGFLRVFGNGNVRIGDGSDNGFPFQTKGNASMDGDIFLEATRVIKGRDSAGTAIRWGAFSSVDNFLRLGAGSAPATAGGTILEHQGVEVARVSSLGFGLNRTANGASWQTGSASELLTLSNVAAFTDTVGNLLPANSIIEAVVVRVVTAITVATDWKVGDAATPARFAPANAVMGAGTVGIGLQHQQGSVATDAAGPVQLAAAPVRITTTGIPGAGQVRVTVFYRTFVAPQS